MIRLRFVNHPGIFTVLVKYAQGGFPLTHCEAMLPEGGVIAAWYKGGVQIKPVGYDAGAFERELFMSLDATPEQETAFFGFLKDQLGKPYDAMAIASFALGRDWQCPDSWFCAQLIAAAQVEASMFPKMLAARSNKIMVKDVAFYNAAKAT